MGKPAPKGNKYNNKFVKMKELGLVEKAYDSYCKHLESGAKRETWCFDDPKLQLTWETMEKHVHENPTDFPPIKHKLAFTKGYRAWEEIAEQHAKGKNKCATAGLQMVMRNKFGWDKKEDIMEEGQKALTQEGKEFMDRLVGTLASASKGEAKKESRSDSQADKELPQGDSDKPRS